MAALFHLPEDVSEEELNVLVPKAFPEKTKIGRKYGQKISKVKKKFEVSIYQKKYCSFVCSSEIFTKTIRILALNFYRQSIE